MHWQYIKKLKAAGYVVLHGADGVNAYTVLPHEKAIDVKRDVWELIGCRGRFQTLKRVGGDEAVRTVLGVTDMDESTWTNAQAKFADAVEDGFVYREPTPHDDREA